MVGADVVEIYTTDRSSSDWKVGKGDLDRRKLKVGIILNYPALMQARHENEPRLAVPRLSRY